MLNVVTENSGDTLIVRCRGRLVAGAEAWTLYNAVIFEKNARAVVLDLTQVNRVDARGLGVLVVLNQWATGSGIRLQLVPSKQVEELLAVTHLRALFEVRDSEFIFPAAESPEASRQDDPARRCA